jgi:hypothetical protein
LNNRPHFLSLSVFQLFSFFSFSPHTPTPTYSLSLPFSLSAFQLFPIRLRRRPAAPLMMEMNKKN